MIYVIKPRWYSESSASVEIKTTSVSVAKHYLDAGVAVEVEQGKVEILPAVVKCNGYVLLKEGNWIDVINEAGLESSARCVNSKVALEYVEV